MLRFLTYKAQNFEQIIVFCKGGKAGQLEEKYKSIPNLIIHSKNISFFNPKDYIYFWIQIPTSTQLKKAKHSASINVEWI